MTNKHNKDDYVIIETINGILETVHKSELTKVMTHYKCLRIDCLPDLLEALEGMIEALREQARLAEYVGGHLALSDKNAPAWDKARAAIARARGES